MGREVRKVPLNWQHPKDENNNFIPLLEGDHIRSEGCEENMPKWNSEEAPCFMMYETCSEGTPISPAFEKKEDLANWLVENKASWFGNNTADYDSWMKVINGSGAYLLCEYKN